MKLKSSFQVFKNNKPIGTFPVMPNIVASDMTVIEIWEELTFVSAQELQDLNSQITGVIYCMRYDDVVGAFEPLQDAADAKSNDIVCYAVKLMKSEILHNIKPEPVVEPKSMSADLQYAYTGQLPGKVDIPLAAKCVKPSLFDVLSASMDARHAAEQANAAPATDVPGHTTEDETTYDQIEGTILVTAEEPVSPVKDAMLSDSIDKKSSTYMDDEMVIMFILWELHKRDHAVIFDTLNHTLRLSRPVLRNTLNELVGRGIITKTILNNGDPCFTIKKLPTQYSKYLDNPANLETLLPALKRHLCDHYGLYFIHNHTFAKASVEIVLEKHAELNAKDEFKYVELQNMFTNRFIASALTQSPLFTQANKKHDTGRTSKIYKRNPAVKITDVLVY